VTLFAQTVTDMRSFLMPTKLPLATRLMNALVVYVAYLRKALLPRDLLVFYPYDRAALTWTAVGVAAVLFLGISIAAIISIRRWPFVFVGWAWYVVSLLPMIGIVQVGRQQMADRYTYFPLIGASLAVAWLVPELLPRGVMRARVLPVAATAALCVFGSGAFVQVGYWRDGLTLLEHAIASEPNDPFIGGMLGVSLVSRGRGDEGLAYVKSAVSRQPQKAKAHYSLALVLQQLGRTDEAAEEYDCAIALDDSYADPHDLLGLLLAGRGKYQEAKRHFLRAAELAPRYAAPYVNLGAICLTLKEYASAIEYSERALQLDPDQLACHVTIGRVLRAQGRLDDAIRQFERLLQTAPDYDEARSELERTLVMRQQG
jgi:tetratricopeptide (TPR) repeat protein